MTAEVAIANRVAVALAADSALTITRTVADSGDKESVVRKVYSNADKLFELLRGHPVGIMLYDSAEILAVPWETIIKSYREESSSVEPFSDIEQYANAFIDWIEANCNRFFPIEVAADFCAQLLLEFAEGFLEYCKNEISARVETENNTRLNNALREKVLDELLDAAEKNPPPANENWASELEPEHLCSTYGEARLLAAIPEKLQALKLKNKHRRRLRDVALRAILSTSESEYQTGLVIAGFGQDNIFPTVLTMTVGGLLDGRLMVQNAASAAISHTSQSFIIPFAQSDDARMFLSGINPEVKGAIEEYWSESLNALPRGVTELLEAEGVSISPGQRRRLLRQVRKYSSEVWNRFAKHMNDLHREYHQQPIIESASFLSKAELAALADNLVDLASMRSRVAMDREETVGGATDVAVISRGDGFIWVKRKHYFSSEVNPVWASRKTAAALPSGGHRSQVAPEAGVEDGQR